jgi:hypothetical protein
MFYQDLSAQRIGFYPLCGSMVDKSVELNRWIHGLVFWEL